MVLDKNYPFNNLAIYTLLGKIAFEGGQRSIFETNKPMFRKKDNEGKDVYAFPYTLVALATTAVSIHAFVFHSTKFSFRLPDLCGAHGLGEWHTCEK